MSNRPQLALGQVETIGLPTAIAAADAGVKSADVTLVGYELARGGGFVAVKFVGGVGAVQAAVAAAKVAATKVGKVARSSVIARPSEQLAQLVENSQTVGWTAPEPPPAPETEPAPQEPAPQEPAPEPAPTPEPPEPAADVVRAEATPQGEEQ